MERNKVSKKCSLVFSQFNLQKQELQALHFGSYGVTVYRRTKMLVQRIPPIVLRFQSEWYLLKPNRPSIILGSEAVMVN